MHTLPVFHCEYQTYPSLVVVRTLRVDPFVGHNVFEGIVHKRLMAGEPVELHRVIMAGQQAGLAFELMMGVRNKVVEAYREVMRMQV